MQNCTSAQRFINTDSKTENSSVGQGWLMSELNFACKLI